MKKIITILLVVVLLFGSYTVVAAEDAYNPGDVNGDGFIDAVDALNILRYAVAGFPAVSAEPPIFINRPDFYFGAGCGPIPGQYNTVGDLLAAVRAGDPMIEDFDLLYVPRSIPDAYQLDFVQSGGRGIYYQYYYNKTLSTEIIPSSCCITIEMNSDFSVEERANELITKEGANPVSIFKLSGGQKVVMYQAAFSIVFFETALDNVKIMVSTEPSSIAIKEAVKKGDKETMKQNINEYMKTQAQKDFEKLLSEFRFKNCDAGVVISGDVTGDGIINAVDALYVLQYAVGKRGHFPAEDVSN